MSGCSLEDIIKHIKDVTNFINESPSKNVIIMGADINAAIKTILNLFIGPWKPMPKQNQTAPSTAMISIHPAVKEMYQPNHFLIPANQLSE